MSLQDFVNREEHLNLIRETVAGKSQIRLLLVSGESGIGKTYLFHACRDHCRSAKVLHFTIDFVDANFQNYLGLIHAVRRQLGYDKFGALNQALIDVRMLSQRGIINPLTDGKTLDKNMAADSRLFGGGSGVGFTDSTVTLRDVAGRDINYITQIIRDDDPFVQTEIRERISAVWQDSLRALAADRPLICFIDAWEKSSQDMKGWLQSTLISAVIDEQITNIVVVLAGQTVPVLPRMPGRISHITLDTLSKDAVQQYWLEIRGLAAQEWENVYRLTRGHPNIVAALADLQTFSRI